MACAVYAAFSVFVSAFAWGRGEMGFEAFGVFTSSDLGPVGGVSIVMLSEVVLDED